LCNENGRLDSFQNEARLESVIHDHDRVAWVQNGDNESVEEKYIMKQIKKYSVLAAGAVAAGLLLGASTAQAANTGVILDGNNNVTRIENLELNFDRDEFDGLYDVDFINGTGLNIYGSEDNFDFPPEENAIAIIQVNNALNLNNPVPTGASSAGTNQFFIPAIEYFGLWAAFGGQFSQLVGGWDACESDCLSGISVLRPSDVLTYAKFTLADGEPPPPSGVDLTGDVQDQGGTSLCSLVLASGQFVFSCNPNGPYSLLDLPTESDGTVKRQVFVDGFFPAVDVLQDSVDETVVMTRSGTCPNYNPPYNPGVFPESAGKRFDISGAILQQNTQTPVCAMVLANGQFTFSCDGSGSYALNIPLDANGQFKLQVYAEGFAPITQTFDEFQTINEVRLARATECQPPGTPPDSNTVCNLALCAGDPTLAQQCETFVQTCLTAEGVLDEQCAAGGLFICLGEELPPETDQSNVCTRDLCANNDTLAQKCQTFLAACLIAEPQSSSDECVGGALLICSDLF